MSAPGIQAAVLGLFLLLGVTAQGGKNGLIIRPGLPELCKEAPNTSDCDVAVQFRWYYDMFSDSCMVFPHRGCANSPNIFKNRKECVQVCIKTPVILPKPWEDTTSVDQLDEIYGEPVMKPEIGNEPGRMPFIAAESNQAPPRPPIEGRSIRGSPYSSNFRPRSDPLMRPAPGSYNSNPKPYGPSVGFPPRGLQRMPHDEQHPMGSAGRFGRQQNYNDKHGRRPAPGPLTESFEEESPIDLMTDQDILDKIDLFGKKPNESQPMPKKAAADSDFMSDSDIFENRQEKDLYGEKPTMDNGQNAMEGKDENEADVVNAKVAPPCMQIPETGPCRAYIRRWYFDPREHDCFTFIFGGCDGNKNSFETKYDCMKRCAMPSEEMEQASSEPMTPLSSKRQQFGLRRQRNPPPVVLTSPAANRTPPVTSAPVQTEGTNAELEQIDSQQSGDDSLDGVDNSGSESGSQELSTTSIEGRQADSLPRVTNHYYTYHNYGPRHTNYGAFRTSSKSSEDNSASTLSEEENDQEKKIQKKSRKQKKKKNGSSKPTPFNMFFKFLRRLRPRKPRIMMHSEERPEGHRGKQGGVKLVTLLFTKRGRQQDSVNPFSSLMSLTAPRQSNPFSIFFNRPEPREVPDFRPHPPHYKSGLPYAGEALHYNNGPQYNHGPQYNSRPPYEHGPHSHYDNRPHYFNGPHFNSPPFLKGPNFYHSPESMSNPIRSLLFPPVDRLVSPMSNILNQFQSPFFSTNRVAPHGEKNVACGKPIDVGSCPGSPLTSQWYYDAQRGVCDVFFYTGCGGNENRFGSLKQCHDVCVVMTPAPPIAQSKPAEETNAISPVTVVVDPVPPQPKEPQPVQPEKSHSEQLEQIETEQQPEPVQILEVQPELELPAEETPEFNIVKEEQYEIEKEEQEEEKEKVKEEEKQAEAQKEAKQLMEEKPVEEREVIVPHQVIQATPVVHTFEFSNMRLDTRMEYVLVVIIMILGGAALIVLVAITAYFMYKKHKLAVRNQKEASIQKVFQAHAYPEVQKISVIELLRQGQGQLPAVHDVVLKNADPNIS